MVSEPLGVGGGINVAVEGTGGLSNFAMGIAGRPDAEAGVGGGPVDMATRVGGSRVEVGGGLGVVGSSIRGRLSIGSIKGSTSPEIERSMAQV